MGSHIRCVSLPQRRRRAFRVTPADEESNSRGQNVSHRNFTSLDTTSDNSIVTRSTRAIPFAADHDADDSERGSISAFTIPFAASRWKKSVKPSWAAQHADQ